jgi:anti-anti-sigma factor
LTTLEHDLARRKDDLDSRAQSLANDVQLLSRQRKEISSRAMELSDLRKRLKGQLRKADEARGTTIETKRRLDVERADIAQQREQLQHHESESATEHETPPAGIETVRSRRPDSSEADILEPDMSGKAPSGAEFNILESTRHNKVFRTERMGATLIVTPLGDASDFHYDVVHTEANKVRRLLDNDAFANIVVDLGNAPFFGAVTINVVVAVSRIASNRGGRAVLCNASEKTRGVLQSMKLLELWPHFETRADAMRAVAGVDSSGSSES